MIKDILEIELPSDKSAFWFKLEEVSCEKVSHDLPLRFEVRATISSKYITELADFQSRFRNKKFNAVVKDGNYRGDFFGGLIYSVEYMSDISSVKFYFDNITWGDNNLSNMSETIKKELKL